MPVSVYDNLIAEVHGHLDTIHRYLELRRKADRTMADRRVGRNLRSAVMLLGRMRSHDAYDATWCPSGDDNCDGDPDNWTTIGCSSCLHLPL